MPFSLSLRAAVFLSTPSARRATCAAHVAMQARLISIHALREEGDTKTSVCVLWGANFYPRPPRGGRPWRSVPMMNRPQFLSTPSARRATVELLVGAKGTWDFYPRPPRGGRPPIRVVVRGLTKFLSTPSARRATRSASSVQTRTTHFYPRPPRGGRRQARNPPAWSDYFYPRPPRGGRLGHGPKSAMLIKFLSTPSARRATPLLTTWRTSRENFYPRPPRGGRRVQLVENIVDSEFLSTPSARRATSAAATVSITMPFLSTPSARRATR